MEKSTTPRIVKNVMSHRATAAPKIGASDKRTQRIPTYQSRNPQALWEPVPGLGNLNCNWRITGSSACTALSVNNSRETPVVVGEEHRSPTRPMKWISEKNPLKLPARRKGKKANLKGTRTFCFFFFFKHVYWSIIALQCCVSFCFITKWISYTYTYVPISLPSCVSLLPTLPIPPL